MIAFRRRQVIRNLVELGMVEMKPTGRWGLTSEGRDFLDQIEVMRALDDRPDAEVGGPGQSGAVTPPPKSEPPRDDDRRSRGRRGKRTKS